MHQKINVLFDYFHGRAKGLDVIDHAEKIKQDSDVILNEMTESRLGRDVDGDLSIASSVLLSLKTKGSTNDGVPERKDAGTLRTLGKVKMGEVKMGEVKTGKVKMGKMGKVGKVKVKAVNKLGNTFVKRFANQNQNATVAAPDSRRRVRKFAKRILSEEDVCMMNTAVEELGGADKVSENKCWKKVARCIRTEEELKTQTSASSDIKKLYASIFLVE